MKNILFNIAAVVTLLFSSLQTIAQENDTLPQKPSVDNWDNFRERDASVYYFTFCVPESYVASSKTAPDSKFLSGMTVYSSFNKAKYEVFQILEEELSKKTNKKFVVADPDQEKAIFKAYSPSCSSRDGKYGFDNFPSWMFKRFLKYDEEVPYLVNLTVEIEDRVGLKSSLLPDNITPKCIIRMTIYDRDKNKIGKYKYVKKDFDKIRVHSSENTVFDRLLNSVWDVKKTKGLALADIMSIYVQTLEEMMEQTDIIIP